MRILMLGAMKHAANCLFELGHEVALITDQAFTLPSDFDSRFSSFTCLESHASLGDWKRLASALHESKPFERIFAWFEHDQAIAAELADDWKLPTIYDRKLVHRTVDKFVMRKILREHDLDPTRSLLAQSADDISLFAEVGRRYIAKPVDGHGSKGVSSFAYYGIDQLPVLEWPVLVEEFLHGPEYSVESFSENGMHRILGITEKHKDSMTFMEIGHPCM